jgi:coenzyme F420-0:L-glutamate ligase/coenzyme F420-1:gamma-L-glutamate ligase
MDALNALRKRRSVRRYLTKAIEDNTITEILETAILAPSAHNSQPWRFLVLKNHETKRKLAETMAQAYKEDLIKDRISPEMRETILKSSVERFTSAPVLIIAGLTMRDMNHYPDKERQIAEYKLAVQSVAVAIQNILIASFAKGLGACWFCAPLFCQEAVRKAVGIPEDVEPQALITLGYPDEEPSTPSRLPLEEVIL